MHPVLFYPAWIVIKIFDIIISLFVGFLDIIGILAKVISLAFRLFGNMLSGTVLLSVLMVGL
jgi:F0F1-type ATP synthase membrane subunit a